MYQMCPIPHQDVIGSDRIKNFICVLVCVCVFFSFFFFFFFWGGGGGGGLKLVDNNNAFSCAVDLEPD